MSDHDDELDDDVANAWSCAANLTLYDEDPGRRRVNAGSVREPRWVDRREALIDLYASQMLLFCDGDDTRLRATAEQCRRRQREARRWRSGWQIMKKRRAHDARQSWRQRLDPLTPWRRVLADLG